MKGQIRPCRRRRHGQLHHDDDRAFEKAGDHQHQHDEDDVLARADGARDIPVHQARFCEEEHLEQRQPRIPGNGDRHRRDREIEQQRHVHVWRSVGSTSHRYYPHASGRVQAGQCDRRERDAQAPQSAQRRHFVLSIEEVDAELERNVEDHNRQEGSFHPAGTQRQERAEQRDHKAVEAPGRHRPAHRPHPR